MQSDSDDGTASGKRSTVRPAIEAVGNFVLVFAFGVAIATHSWFAPLFIGAPLVAMVYTRNRVAGRVLQSVADLEDVPSSVELRWRPGEHQAALTLIIVHAESDRFGSLAFEGCSECR